MGKPLIAITCNTTLAEGQPFPGIFKSFVNYDYITAVTKAGGIPLLLPPAGDYEAVREQVRAVHGVILAGGQDIDPSLYGEEPLEKLGTVNRDRDNHELQVVKAAEELHKPILGICRGIQILNVAFGGTLYQDVSQIEGCRIKHYQSTTQRDTLWHTVDIEPTSALAGIIGGRDVAVNSYHHQALKTVAPEFTVTARSKDGVIEAVERRGDHFVLGVQWHPEVLADKFPAMLAIFEAIIEKAGKR